MIDQQINLYQDRFREKRLWVSASQVAWLLLAALILGGLWSARLELDIRAAEAQTARLESERGQLAGELVVARAELQSLLADNRYDRELNRVRRESDARRRVLRFVEANRFGSGEGFAAYLEALSRLHVDELWLRRIRLAENDLQLEGSALDAARVPQYFSRFGGEQVFAGARFDLFDLERPGDADWRVDFRIATRGEDGG